MKILQGIIFDVDGTLADTEDVHRLAFNHVFQEYGLDWNWTPELYRELLAISGGRERIADFGRRLRRRFASDAAFTDFVVAMHKAKTRKYAAMLTEGEVRLRPGIRRLLEEARAAGLKLGIATSSARRSSVGPCWVRRGSRSNGMILSITNWRVRRASALVASGRVKSVTRRLSGTGLRRGR